MNNYQFECPECVGHQPVAANLVALLNRGRTAQTATPILILAFLLVIMTNRALS